MLGFFITRGGLQIMRSHLHLFLKCQKLSIGTQQTYVLLPFRSTLPPCLVPNRPHPAFMQTQATPGHYSSNPKSPNSVQLYHTRWRTETV